MLNRMEKEGLIVRVRKGQGHPLTEVKLTAKGRKLCSPRVAVLKDVIAEIMSAMSDEELAQLVELTRPLQTKALEMLRTKLKKSPGRPEEITMPVKRPKSSKKKGV